MFGGKQLLLHEWVLSEFEETAPDANVQFVLVPLLLVPRGHFATQSLAFARLALTHYFTRRSFVPHQNSL